MISLLLSLRLKRRLNIVLSSPRRRRSITVIVIRLPLKYLSLVIDGEFPTSRTTKAVDGFQQPVHVTRVLAHGTPIPALVLLSDERVPKDANMTINAITHIIRLLHQHGVVIPPRLLLQLDNCAGE